MSAQAVSQAPEATGGNGTHGVDDGADGGGAALGPAETAGAHPLRNESDPVDIRRGSRRQISIAAAAVSTAGGASGSSCALRRVRCAGRPVTWEPVATARGAHEETLRLEDELIRFPECGGNALQRNSKWV